MRLLIMADTHVPKRARELPEPLWDEVAAADVVVHAGDWVELALLDRLEQRATRLIGVYGNNDGPGLRARLPEVARAELGGVRLAVVHETGAAKGREQRCARDYPDTDVLVFGQCLIRVRVMHSRNLGYRTRLTCTRPPRAALRKLRAAPVDRVVHNPHSHIPWDSVAPSGLRLLNPGSPTDRRRQPHCTYLTARLGGGALTEVELHALPGRR